MKNQYTCPTCEKRRGKMKGVCLGFNLKDNTTNMCKSEHTPTYTAQEIKKLYNDKDYKIPEKKPELIDPKWSIADIKNNYHIYYKDENN